MCKNYRTATKVIFISRYLLVFSLLAVITCLLISYPYAKQFSIPTQITAHVFTIIFAGSFKVAVVALMAASKEIKTIPLHTPFEKRNAK